MLSHFVVSLFAARALIASAQSAPKVITSTGNPIIADGSYYTADPAPIVVNNTLYILTGRDSAPPNQNDFIMNEWELLESKGTPNPAGSQWNLYPAIAKPSGIFSWAEADAAYAAQIVQGPDKKFYLYAPVRQRNSPNADPFAIGVAVADKVTGPYKDAHPSGPILSQSVPAPGNNIQNIDPTVLVDTDGRIYVYYGTFGQLRAYELNKDMITTKGAVTTVNSLTGFFEAPWLMKRGSTYYMIYAANNAGADSPCTPTSYHACIAYGTASSPLGPWTFRGIVLGIVSSTTSHPGVALLGNQHYLIYHTADATGGGNFRRSVAFDKLDFDDTKSPPAIKRVVPTKRAGPPRQPSRNVAPKAKVTSANVTPIQYWVEALHDEKIPSNPLPPEYWSSYNGAQSPKTNTLTYTWDAAVTLNGTRMAFFADQPAGSNVGVPPPASWYVEYQTTAGAWQRVSANGAYPVAVTDNPAAIGFTQVTTKAIRAVLTASGSGSQFGGVGVKEWEALATTAS